MRADAKELTALRERVASLEAENALLRQKIDALVRRVFGTSSERIDPAQLELLLQLPAPPPLPAEDPAKASPRVFRSARPARALAPPARRSAGGRGSDRTRAGPGPARGLAPHRPGGERPTRLRTGPLPGPAHRPPQVCSPPRSGSRAPLIAPLPGRLQDRSLAAPGLLAHILVSKYCDHLPLHRQEQIFARRHGVQLPRQTLARWVALAADWPKPIYEQIRTGVLSGGHVQIDETPIRYLAPGHGQTKHGYLWTTHRPRGDVIYQWHTRRAAACLDQVVPARFTGTIQCDGYAAAGAFADRRAGAISLAGCWAHVRRKIRDALEQSPRTAGWLLRQLQHLYRVEAHLREHRAGPRLRQARRAHQSRPLVQRIPKAHVRLKASHRHLPQSLLGQAIDYTLGQWHTLENFLTDGRVEIDNNLVENAIRPTALGKKNWLFIGAAHAGERSAILHTVIESCRRRNLDPYAYLRDVLTRLPTMTNRQIGEVTPEAWAKAQRSRTTTSAINVIA